jgi:hypothetical protein
MTILMERRWPMALLVLLMAAGMGLCFWVILTRKMSDVESLLVGIVLTILSIIASWITSSYYADYSFNKNLRTFAHKAAEKVNNLSNELDRLSTFLQEELNAETTDPATALNARDMRIEGAIHIINTLKSVNDRSLSDWQGVIGDEIIAAERERREEREQQYRELLARVDVLSTPKPTIQDVPNGHLTSEIEEIRKEIRVLGAQFGGVPSRRASSTKRLIESRCPSCGQLTHYKQKAKDESGKHVTCSYCRADLYSTYRDGAFVLQQAAALVEKFACPGCKETLAVRLPTRVGASKHVTCGGCERKIAIGRGRDEVVIRVVGSASAPHAPIAVSEDFLERVKKTLPPQPWPQGTSKRTAEQLGVSAHHVQRAVTVLIERGEYKVQHAGKLYSPASN